MKNESDFIHAIAPHLNGFVVHSDRAMIDERGVVMEVHFDGRGRIEVRTWHPKVREISYYGNRPEWPSATYARDRDPATVARDIKRRVIDASAGPFERMSAIIAEQDRDKGALAKIAATLEALEVQGLEASVDGNDCVQVHFSPRGIGHIRARITAKGSVTIDRGWVDLDKFTALLSAFK